MSRIIGIAVEVSKRFVVIQISFRFFKTPDWEDVYQKRLKPPIVPKAKPGGDVRNIEATKDTHV
jgi:hypothetical protein